MRHCLLPNNTPAEKVTSSAPQRAHFLIVVASFAMNMDRFSRLAAERESETRTGHGEDDDSQINSQTIKAGRTALIRDLRSQSS